MMKKAQKNILNYIRGKFMEKKRTWICYYINSKGNERQKVFNDMEDGLAFTQLLDKRIERGTCGGYSFMEI